MSAPTDKPSAPAFVDPNAQIEAKPMSFAESVPDLHATSTRPPADAPLADVMGGDLRRQIQVHEHGFVALVDCMPRLVPTTPGETPTADGAIVQAARVSYGAGTKKVNEDRGLIRYLLRHRHTTPFEMVEFKFHVAMPVFVARQWIRHRTANVNEYSARYSILPDRFYTPTADAVRKQSTSNRQGGDDTFTPDEVTTAQDFLDYLAQTESLYKKYESLTEAGVSRELARIGLPVSVYTEWYWKCDLHNTLRFLSLRMDPHAQQEIRDFAFAMYRLIEPLVPITCEAFGDYELDALHLTRLEIAALRDAATGGRGELDSTNKRERAEWAAKRTQLGL
ncbi:MAG: FAD-dependent thymidylate synthase [Planctomycetota bacterium]